MGKESKLSKLLGSLPKEEKLEILNNLLEDEEKEELAKVEKQEEEKQEEEKQDEKEKQEETKPKKENEDEAEQKIMELFGNLNDRLKTIEENNKKIVDFGAKRQKALDQSQETFDDMFAKLH